MDSTLSERQAVMRSLMKLVPRSFYCELKVSLNRNSEYIYGVKKERERINLLASTAEIISHSKLTGTAIESSFQFRSSVFFLCLLAHVRRISTGKLSRIPLRLYIHRSPQTSHGINLSSKQAVTHTNRTQTMLQRLFFRLSICLSCPPLFAIQCLVLIPIEVEYTRDIRDLSFLSKECF